MANFAIAADDAVITRGNQLIEQLQEPGEKKGAALNRLFDLAAGSIQDGQLKKEGVDTEALNASLNNIRNLFTAALSGKEEIRAEFEQKLAAQRSTHEASEAKYQKEILLYKEETQKAVQEANLAKAAAAAAEKEAQAAKKETQAAEKSCRAMEEQLAAAKQLTSEKDKTNIMLMEKLRLAEQKASVYADLEKDMESLQRELSEKRLLIKDHEKALALLEARNAQLGSEKETALSDLDALKKTQQELIQAQEGHAQKLREQEQEISQLNYLLDEQKKDAELACDRAVIVKEREMLAQSEKLREEIDRLKEENYSLKLQLAQKS